MLDGRRRAWKVDEGLYLVWGRMGEPYLIPISASGLPLCPCVAGSGDSGRFAPKACWHAALVLARLQREQ